MELSSPNLSKAATNNGLIIAAITIFISLITYYALPSLLGSTLFSFGLGLFALILYIYFTIDLRKKVGGYWSFRSALKGILIMATTAVLVTQIFNYAFYKLVEPNAYEKVSGIIIQGVTDTMESWGSSEEKIDEAVADVELRLKKQYDPTFGEFALFTFYFLLLAVVMSLIFAAIFKKEAPIFAPVEDDVD